MIVHVLLYDSGKETEGIHSIEINGNTIVLMFEEEDDAIRYCGLLEAQDFPSPTIERIDKSEIESFCDQSGYEARFVKRGFTPQTEEDRLLLSPPNSNLDVSSWDQETKTLGDQNSDLDQIKNRLEKLL